MTKISALRYKQKKKEGYTMTEPITSKRKILPLLTAIVAAAVLISGCESSKNGENTSSNTTVSTGTSTDGTDSTTASTTEPVKITEGYIAVPDSVTIPTDGNTIVFEGSTIEAKGNGMSVDGNKVTITSSGIYTISGTLDDGQIIVDTTNDGTVVLALYGVTMYSSVSAPIYVVDAQDVTIKLIDDTISSISDNSSYTYDSDTETDPNSTIFSKESLTFTGNGTLIVNANYKNAIASKDDLTFESGTYQITSIEDGIVGKDSVTVTSGTFTIESGVDGIKSTNATDADKGTVTIKDGAFSITSTNDAIQAETALTINGGTFNLTTGGGSANASASHGNNDWGGGMDWGNWTKPDGQPTNPGGQQTMSTTSEDTTDTESTSAKGLKGLVSVTINGGTFNIYSADDSLHSNDTVTINNGTFSIASGDDGAHADNSLIINDGTIDITKSYEGLEGCVIEINGGKITLVSSDDGINVAGGNDSSGFGMGFGGQQSTTASSEYYLKITGGYIYINAGGDGLDSNGDIIMTAGEVYVDGPVDNGNGALDYQDNFTISGGILVAVGSSGMAEPPSTSSTQNTIAVTANFSVGDVITLKDSSGNTLLTYNVTKTAASAIISIPEIATGSTYTVYTNDTETGNVTVSSAVSYIGGSGGWFGGGGGGNMGGGRR